MQTLIKKLQNISFSGFFKSDYDDYADCYNTAFIDKDLTPENVIDYIDIFSFNLCGKIFITNVLRRKLYYTDNKRQLYEAIKDFVPHEVYILFNLYLKDDDSNKQLVNDIQITDIPIIIYALMKNIIDSDYQHILINKIMTLGFNPVELRIIRRYLKCSNIQLIFTWLRNSFVTYAEFGDLNQQSMRDMLIRRLFEYTYDIDKCTTENFKNLRCFDKELTGNPDILYKYCELQLLTKEIIDNIFEQGGYLFEVLIENSMQYQEYIESLALMNQLSG